MPSGNMPVGGFTVKQMLGKGAGGTGPVPTQTFYASNIAGTTVPKVGAVQGTPTQLSGQFAQVKPTQIVIVVLVLIGAGYLLHHLNFQESVRAGV